MKIKKLILTTIAFFVLLAVFGQNGLKTGNLFLLLKNKKTISINSFEKNKINELKSYSISEKSIYTTDQKSKIAILDTAKNNLTLFDIQTSGEFKITIPFELKPKSILLNDNNLFISGEMGKEMLVQYHMQSEKWYQLEIPEEVLFLGKAIDDLIINDSLLIAIDNIVMPKYILFYHLNPKDKLKFSNFKELKSNGTYESIHQGRITNNYLGLISGTYSGYVGATEHITIYNNLNLTSSFTLSYPQQDKDYHTFTDFVIIGDKIVIARKEEGLGVFEIEDSYFKDSEGYNNNQLNPRVNTSKIKYENFSNETIIKITIIPNTEIIILTLEDRKGRLREEIRKI